jgi:hypothetical protein
MPSRRHYTRMPKNRRCKGTKENPGCGKAYADGGFTAAKHCPTCYETKPTAPSADCCYKCLTQPLGYECPRPRCECPQHANMSALLDQYGVAK